MKKIKYLALFLIALIFLATAMKMKDNFFEYLIFSIVFNSIFFIGLFKTNFFVVNFLSLFIWLGFWCKTSSIVLLGRYVEFVGLFGATTEEWSKTLTVSSVGGLAVIAAILVAQKSFNKIYSNKIFSSDIIPSFYKENRKVVHIVFVIVVVLMSVLNYTLGVHTVGLYTKVEWPFIIEKFYTWMIMHGLAIAACVFVFWDELLSKSLKSSFILVLVEAFFTNTFKLSRAYVFHIFPQVVALLKKSNWVAAIGNIKKAIIFFVLIISLFFISSWSVSNLRNEVFTAVLKEDDAYKVKVKPPESTINHSKFSKALGFVIDRWVGVEGVMATISYGELSWDLQKQVFYEISTPGKTSIFDEKIAKSNYKNTNKERARFITLPGAMAFFFFSGSYLILFAGLFSLVLLGILLEWVCWRITYNKYLAAYFSAALALDILQFGYQPLKFFAYQIVFGVSFLFVFVVQNLNKKRVS